MLLGTTGRGVIGSYQISVLAQLLKPLSDWSNDMFVNLLSALILAS